MAIHIIDEANRCLNCKKPKCMEGCPVHTPIPHIIQMFKEHKVMEAGKELFQQSYVSNLFDCLRSRTTVRRTLCAWKERQPGSFFKY